jgi:hypothetical protein
MNIGINLKPLFDYLENKKLNWKLVGKVTGTTSIKLPDDFSELFIEVRPATGYPQTFTVIRDILASSNANYCTGFSGDSNQFIKVGISLADIKIAEVSYGGTDRTNVSTLTVYYK